MKYWRIGTSDGETSFWNEMESEGKVSIGWPEIGDLSHVQKDKAILMRLFADAGYFTDDTRTRSRKAGEVLNFCLKVTEGDVVLAQDGDKVLGIGVVDGPYEFNKESGFPHHKRTKWLISNPNLYNDIGRLTTVYLIENEETIARINSFIKDQNQETSQNTSKTGKVKQQLNQILFGPPGTGKTYHTVNRAMEIVTGKSGEAIEAMDRVSLKADYDNMVKGGQIAFCTFHQSMSYEDFIEGIKPFLESSLDDRKEGIDEKSNTLGYSVRPGIFKRIARKASEAKEYKLSFDDLWEMFRNFIAAEDEYIFKTIKGKALNYRPNEIAGEVITVQYENSYHGQGDGRVPYRISKASIEKPFKAGKTIIDSMGRPNKMNSVIVDKGNRSETYAVYRGFFEFVNSLDTQSRVEKFVLIIDEINRGNLSQIFGELITLIEDDKRAGRPEALEVILPYSKEPFSVPPNLYIIGTMNTADRSVEALDTALRRRFVFEEMPPKPELLSLKWMICRFWNSDPSGNIASLAWKKLDWNKEPYFSQAVKFFELYGLNKDEVEANFDEEPAGGWDYSDWEPSHLSDVVLEVSGGVNLETLLKTINSRIEVLLSKDHQIGHSYFMKVYSEEDLKTAFYKSIIPLLQEYFYGDYGKIGLVLGKGFVRIKSDPQKQKVGFASFPYEDKNDLQKLVYELVSKDELDLPSAISYLLNEGNAGQSGGDED